jgi:hypothetical protein
MDEKDTLLKKAEDEIREAAKAVEDFADKVTAPEEPVVIVPAEDVPKPPAGKDG